MTRHQKKQLFAVIDSQNNTIQTQRYYKKLALSDASGRLSDITFNKSNTNIRLFWYRPADSIHKPDETHEPSIGCFSINKGITEASIQGFDPLMFYSSDQSSVHNQMFCLYDESMFADYKNKFMDVNIFNILAQFINNKIGNGLTVQIIYNQNNNLVDDYVTIIQDHHEELIEDPVYYQACFKDSIFDDVFINYNNSIGNLKVTLNAGQFVTDPNALNYLYNINLQQNDQITERFIFYKQCNLQSLLLTYNINIKYLNILNNAQVDEPLVYINKECFKIYYQRSFKGDEYIQRNPIKHLMFYDDLKISLDGYYRKEDYNNLNLLVCFQCDEEVKLAKNNKKDKNFLMFLREDDIKNINSDKFYRYENTVYIKSKQCMELVGVLTYKDLIVSPINRQIFCWKDLINKTNNLSFQIYSKALNQSNKLITSEDDSLQIFVRLLLRE